MIFCVVVAHNEACRLDPLPACEHIGKHGMMSERPQAMERNYVR